MTNPFTWPNAARCALSLTFDDARLSQPDTGLPILNRHGIKATFYVSPGGVTPRLAAWRQAVAEGHEIGNHTLTHPCSGNFAFVRDNGNPLEAYTLDRMEAELTGANAWIARELGVTPRTFAYPCGETTVGRGPDARSYVPLVAQHFLAGRAYRQECAHDPRHGDLARLCCSGADGATAAHLRALLDASAQSGGWLVLCAHEIAEKGRQALSPRVLDTLCAQVTQPDSGIWVDTVAAVAEYVQQHV